MSDANEKRNVDSPQPPAKMLMFSRDLFFGSKVSGTAGELGLRVELVGDVADGLSRLSAGEYRCVILDLAMPGLVPADVVGSLSAREPGSESPAPCVIAFGSHVDTVRLDEARQAGCELVLPRSRFSAELPEILARHGAADEGRDAG